MKCALCNKQLAPGLALFCRLCWFTKVPAPDRVKLHSMHQRRQPTAAKVESIVRKARERETQAALDELTAESERLGLYNKEAAQ